MSEALHALFFLRCWFAFAQAEALQANEATQKRRQRPKWKPRSRTSPGQRARRDLAKRGATMIRLDHA